MSNVHNYEEEIKQLFASAWQDGVHHLDPKYLRRDSLFTEKVMDILQKVEIEAVEKAKVEAYKKGLLYNKQVHKDFSDLGADVSIQAEIRRANDRLATLRNQNDHIPEVRKKVSDE